MHGNDDLIQIAEKCIHLLSLYSILIHPNFI